MDDFQDRYGMPKLNQDQISHLNSPITLKEIEVVIKSHNKNNKNNLGPMVLVHNSIRPSKKT